MRNTGFSLGGLGLAHLLAAEEAQRAASSDKLPIRPEINPDQPYAPRGGHFSGAAQQVRLGLAEALSAGLALYLATFEDVVADACSAARGVLLGQRRCCGRRRAKTGSADERPQPTRVRLVLKVEPRIRAVRQALPSRHHKIGDHMRILRAEAVSAGA